MNILEELYHGFVHPAEVVCPIGPQYKEAAERIEELSKHLELKLSQEDLEKLEELKGQCFLCSYLESAEAFTYGFRLATMIMTEVYTNKGRMTLDDDPA